MNTKIINNTVMTMQKISVGMDSEYGAGTPMKLKRKAYIDLVPGTELEIWFQGRCIYERKFGNNTEPREILVEVKDVMPYPNCNFWVDDRFLLGGNGIQYAQEIEVRTTAPEIRIIESTFMDK